MADENDKPGFVSFPGLASGLVAGAGTAALTGVYMGSKAKGALKDKLTAEGTEIVAKGNKAIADAAKAERDQAVTEINNMTAEQFAGKISKDIDGIRNAVTEKGAHETLEKAKNAAVEEAAKEHSGIKARLDGMNSGKTGAELDKFVFETGKTDSAKIAGIEAVERKFLKEGAKAETQSALNTVVKQAESNFAKRPFVGGNTMLKVGLGIAVALGTMALVKQMRTSKSEEPNYAAQIAAERNAQSQGTAPAR